jgi:polyphosphate kinase 2 (PPK2 family)
VVSLRDADLSLKLSRKRAKSESGRPSRLLALRLQLGGLIEAPELGPPLCVLFEGWDASGKGGCIRRLASPLDPAACARDAVRTAELG